MGTGRAGCTSAHDSLCIGATTLRTLSSVIPFYLDSFTASLYCLYYMSLGLLIIVFTNVNWENNICLHEANRLHDFRIGISNVPPCLKAPQPWSYSLCATFLDPAGPGALAPMYCPDDLHPGRFIIMQTNFTSSLWMHFCEIQVFGESKLAGK